MVTANSEIRSVRGQDVRMRHTPRQVSGQLKLEMEVVHDRAVILDHALAEKYISLPIFKGEREVVETHVERLFDAMTNGTFNERNVNLAMCEFNGELYKINGQHTCWAVMFMPKDFSIRVRETRYRVETVEQLRMLYATYDRAMPRSDGHLVKVHLVDTPEMEGIPASIISRLTPGLRLWLWENEKERGLYQPDQIASLVRNEYAELYRAVAFYFKEHQEPCMKRASVFAALFETFSKVPSKAPEFWDAVATGLGLTRKADPRWKLRDYLLSTSVRATTVTSDKRVVDAETQYRICINAWNKWRKGEDITGSLRPTQSRVKAR